MSCACSGRWLRTEVGSSKLWLYGTAAAPMSRKLGPGGRPGSPCVPGSNLIRRWCVALSPRPDPTVSISPRRGRNVARVPTLEPERISVGHSFQLRGIYRMHRRGLIEPDVLVELVRQHRFEVVTLELRFGSVDHADGALEPRLPEISQGRGQRTHSKHEVWDPAIVRESLVAVGERGAYRLHLHRLVPVRGGRDGALVRAKADRIAGATEPAPAQVTDVVLVPGRHLGRRRIPHVRVVSPYDRLARGAVELEQILQRREHMIIAQVPRRARSVVHRAVVAFRAGDEARILHGIQEPFAVVLGIRPVLLQ